jgi:hypothetical protein
MKGRLQPGAAKPFEVFTIADTVRSVRARGGLIVQPNFDISNHPTIDLFIVPGGVVTAELKRDSIIGWITRTADQGIAHGLGLHGRISAGQRRIASRQNHHHALGGH